MDFCDREMSTAGKNRSRTKTTLSNVYCALDLFPWMTRTMAAHPCGCKTHEIAAAAFNITPASLVYGEAQQSADSFPGIGLVRRGCQFSSGARPR
jgi:hypothetical protein